MYVLISYDIVKDRTRVKVMKFLKNYGVRAQKSVYECYVNEAQYNRIKNELKELINPLKDRIRFYRVCQACISKIEISGWGSVYEDEDFTIL
ncbi:MAG: CRISPR-associated endonuclease Cas2 [bacterium]